jgi:hypothetical protein
VRIRTKPEGVIDINRATRAERILAALLRRRYACLSFAKCPVRLIDPRSGWIVNRKDNHVVAEIVRRVVLASSYLVDSAR